MTHTQSIPAPAALKAQARQLRSALAEKGTAIPHSAALELLSKQLGFANWNTLSARARADNLNSPRAPASLGARVRGRYLGQTFNGSVKGITALTGERYRLTIRFDEPIDVVTFDSFSAFRRQVTVTVDAEGRTAQRTSDGTPHLELVA